MYCFIHLSLLFLYALTIEKWLMLRYGAWCDPFVAHATKFSEED